jgi:hypothetical protein
MVLPFFVSAGPFRQLVNAEVAVLQAHPVRHP